MMLIYLRSSQIILFKWTTLAVILIGETNKQEKEKILSGLNRYDPVKFSNEWYLVN